MKKNSKTTTKEEKNYTSNVNDKYPNASTSSFDEKIYCISNVDNEPFSVSSSNTSGLKMKISAVRPKVVNDLPNTNDNNNIVSSNKVMDMISKKEKKTRSGSTSSCCSVCSISGDELREQKLQKMSKIRPKKKSRNSEHRKSQKSVKQTQSLNSLTENLNESLHGSCLSSSDNELPGLLNAVNAAIRRADESDETENDEVPFGLKGQYTSSLLQDFMAKTEMLGTSFSSSSHQAQSTLHPSSTPSGLDSDIEKLSKKHERLDDQKNNKFSKKRTKKKKHEKSAHSNHKNNEAQLDNISNKSEMLPQAKKVQKDLNQKKKLDYETLDREMYATERTLYPPKDKSKLTSSQVFYSSKQNKQLELRKDSLDPLWKKIDFNKKFRRPSLSGYKSDGGNSTICSKILAAKSGYVSDYGYNNRSYSGYKSDVSEKSRISVKSCVSRARSSCDFKHYSKSRKKRKIQRKRKSFIAAKSMGNIQEQDILQLAGLSLGHSSEESSRESVFKEYKNKKYGEINRFITTGEYFGGTNNNTRGAGGTTNNTEYTQSNNLAGGSSNKVSNFFSKSNFELFNYDDFNKINHKIEKLCRIPGSIRSRRSSAVSRASSCYSNVSRCKKFRKKRFRPHKSSNSTHIDSKLTAEIEILTNSFKQMCQVKSEKNSASSSKLSKNKHLSDHKTNQNKKSLRKQQQRKLSEELNAPTTKKRHHKKSASASDEHKLPLKKRHYLLGNKSDGKIVNLVDGKLSGKQLLEVAAELKLTSAKVINSLGKLSSAAAAKLQQQIANPKKRHLMQTSSKDEKINENDSKVKDETKNISSGVKSHETNCKTDSISKKKNRLENLVTKIQNSTTLVGKDIMMTSSSSSADSNTPPPGVFEPSIEIEVPLTSDLKMISKSELDSSLNKFDVAKTKTERGVVEKLLNKTGSANLVGIKKKRKKINRTGFPTVRRKKKTTLEKTELNSKDNSDIRQNVQTAAATKHSKIDLLQQKISKCDRVPLTGEASDVYLRRNNYNNNDIDKKREFKKRNSHKYDSNTLILNEIATSKSVSCRNKNSAIVNKDPQKKEISDKKKLCKVALKRSKKIVEVGKKSSAELKISGISVECNVAAKTSDIVRKNNNRSNVTNSVKAIRKSKFSELLNLAVESKKRKAENNAEIVIENNICGISTDTKRFKGNEQCFQNSKRSKMHSQSGRKRKQNSVEKDKNLRNSKQDSIIEYENQSLFSESNSLIKRPKIRIEKTEMSNKLMEIPDDDEQLIASIKTRAKKSLNNESTNADKTRDKLIKSNRRQEKSMKKRMIEKEKSLKKFSKSTENSEADDIFNFVESEEINLNFIHDDIPLSKILKAVKSAKKLELQSTKNLTKEDRSSGTSLENKTKIKRNLKTILNQESQSNTFVKVKSTQNARKNSDKSNQESQSNTLVKVKTTVNARRNSDKSKLSLELENGESKPDVNKDLKTLRRRTMPVETTDINPEKEQKEIENRKKNPENENYDVVDYVNTEKLVPTTEKIIETLNAPSFPEEIDIEADIPLSKISKKTKVIVTEIGGVEQPERHQQRKSKITNESECIPKTLGKLKFNYNNNNKKESQDDNTFTTRIVSERLQKKFFKKRKDCVEKDLPFLKESYADENIDNLEHDPLPFNKKSGMISLADQEDDDYDETSDLEQITKKRGKFIIKKSYLQAGLFSTTFKNETVKLKKSLGQKNNTEKNDCLLQDGRAHQDAILPPPPYCEKYFRRSIQDFLLPYDLWWEYKNSKLSERVNVPSWHYKKIRTNIYGDVVKSNFSVDDHQSCNCSYESECGDDCLNRMVYTECYPSNCPCKDKCKNQKIQRHEVAPGVERFMTDNKGWGVRTTLTIKKGTYILEYVGEVVTEREFKDRMASLYVNDTHHYCLNLDGGLVIDGHRMGSDGRFVNHSCSPNCDMQKWSVNGLPRMALFASRNIESGEELTYDYNFSLFNPSEGQPCRCETPQCRGVIGGKSQRIRTVDTKASDSGPPSKHSRQRKRRAIKNRKNFFKDVVIPQFQPLSEKEKKIVKLTHIMLLRNIEKAKKGKREMFKSDSSRSLTPISLAAQISALKAPRNIKTRGLTQATSDPEIEKVAKIAVVLKEICEFIGSTKREDGKSSISKLFSSSKRKRLNQNKSSKNVIDFSSIKSNIEKGLYKDPTDFDKDVIKMFEIAANNNKTSIELSKICNDLRQNYAEKKAEFYQKLQFLDPKFLHELCPETDGAENSKASIEEDVIRCICGLFRDEGVMIQCSNCLVWQHAHCTKADVNAENYLCEVCEPRETNLEIAMDDFTEEGYRYYLSLLRGTLQIRQGDAVYVLRDIPIDGNIDNKKHTYETIGKVDYSECDIFRVECLWKDSDGKRFIFGHHYLRPHETFHEPSRKFYVNEVVRVPLYEKVPIELVMDRCWVLDRNIYCKGRPNYCSSEEHVYICELKVDKTARFFSRAKNSFPVCTKNYAFKHFKEKQKICRNYAPHDIQSLQPSKSGKKRKANEAFSQLNSKMKCNSNPYVTRQTRLIKTTSEKRSRLENCLSNLKVRIPEFMINSSDLSYLLTGRGARQRKTFNSSSTFLN